MFVFHILCARAAAMKTAKRTQVRSVKVLCARRWYWDIRLSPCWRSKAQIRNVCCFLLAQKRRSNGRRKRKSKLHQVERSPQGNKTGVLTTSIRIHHIGCLLGAFYFHSCNGVHAKSHANTVLSAAWQSCSFVWRDSCTLCILWQFDRWGKKKPVSKVAGISAPTARALMTSDNETVSRLYSHGGGNIAKSVISEGNSVLLSANGGRKRPFSSQI